MTDVVTRDGVRPVQRTDNQVIVTRRGKIARLESSLTPHEAQIEDLVFLRKVLKKANIPYLLIRDHKNRPILVVDVELSSEVEREVTSACGRNADMTSSASMTAGSPRSPRLSPLNV
jgi:hypothetical protein